MALSSCLALRHLDVGHNQLSSVAGLEGAAAGCSVGRCKPPGCPVQHPVFLLRASCLFNIAGVFKLETLLLEQNRISSSQVLRAQARSSSSRCCESFLLVFQEAPTFLWKG
jgi:hypothetical protein